MLSNDIYAIANFDNALIVKTIDINALSKNLNAKNMQIITIRASVIANLTNVQFTLTNIKSLARFALVETRKHKLEKSSKTRSAQKTFYVVKFKLETFVNDIALVIEIIFISCLINNTKSIATIQEEKKDNEKKNSEKKKNIENIELSTQLNSLNIDSFFKINIVVTLKTI